MSDRVQDEYLYKLFHYVENLDCDIKDCDLVCKNYEWVKSKSYEIVVRDFVSKYIYAD